MRRCGDAAIGIPLPSQTDKYVEHCGFYGAADVSYD
jgi:hypothetical protein